MSDRIDITPPPKQPAEADAPEQKAVPDEDKIIDMRGRPLEIQKKEREHKYCLSNHRAIFIDDHERCIWCQECGKVIDAFDYVLDWATKGDLRMRRLKSLDDEIRMTHSKLEEIKKALAREKARVRRVNPDAPEVMTWKRQLALRTMNHESTEH